MFAACGPLLASLAIGPTPGEILPQRQPAVKPAQNLHPRRVAEPTVRIFRRVGLV